MRSDTLGRHVLDTLAQIAAQVIEAPGRRKTIVGIGSGWLFDRPLPPPQAGHDLLPEWVRAMRQKLGDGFPLMVDANIGWSVDQAVRAARTLG